MADNGTEALAAEYEIEQEVHDRRFQAYSLRNEISLEPIDGEEGDRLRLQNDIFKLIFAARPNNREYLNNPIIARVRQIPRRILDCGCGDGSWVVDVANKIPSSEVVGVDISPILAYDIPAELENCRAEVCDLNRDLRTFRDNYFDLVHSRLVAGGIGAVRWQSYLSDIRMILRPGGLVQLFEFDFLFQSDNGSFTSNTALTRWSAAYRRGLESSQSTAGKKDPRIVSRMAGMLARARFSNIRQEVIRVPLSGWQSDPAWRRIGQKMQENVHLLLESLGLYPITTRLGISLGNFEELVARAREELRDLNLKPYMSLYVWTAEKPS